MSSYLPKNSLVLLVEDQPIIAMDVEFILSQYGVTATHTATTTAEALSLISAARPDVAILDFNLRLGTSLPVAEELLARNIPFVFATGYGDNSMIPKTFSHVPVLSKPYDEAHLINALARIMANDATSSSAD